MFMDINAHPDDIFELHRFISAQEHNYAKAEEELRQGSKKSHWMWYVFPQIDGLGRSHTAEHFAIKSLEEATAYLAHEILGARLRLCTEILLESDHLTANDIFASPDDIKLCSCLSLFSLVDDSGLFQRALDKFYMGNLDPSTLQITASLPHKKANEVPPH